MQCWQRCRGLVLRPRAAVPSCVVLVGADSLGLGFPQQEHCRLLVRYRQSGTDRAWGAGIWFPKGCMLSRKAQPRSRPLAPAL